MKAVVCTKYGPPEVLQVREVKKPPPQRDEVCIRIHATAVTASDCIVRGFKLPIWHPLRLLMGVVVGFRGPRNAILGMVLAGEIEAVGEDVTQFKAGDQVFAFTGTRFGGYAEYICLPETSKSGLPGTIPGVLALKPATLNYEEAAAVVFGTVLASHYLRRGQLQRGQKVLIYGASGAIGTTAVQIAKHHYGAEVTAVCGTANLDFVSALGADHVLDYTQQDSLPAGARYDFVLDAVGKKKSSPLKLACQTALTANGQYVSVDQGSPMPRPEDLVLIRTLIEAGKFKAVIDRQYPLDAIVEAHRYVDQGHKKGNVVITVAQGGEDARAI